MANVQDGHGVAGSGVEEQGAHDAEHPGFLHKLKEKLHIGHKHKEEQVVDSGDHAAGKGATKTGAPPVVSDVAGAPVSKNVTDAGVIEPPPPPTTTTSAATAAAPDHQEHVRPPSSDTGRESEHHGGVRTFLATLPDQDIPAEDSPKHSQLHHTPKGENFEQAHQGEHHGVVPEGGVPTFLASLPDRDIPAEDSPKHSQLHHTPAGENSEQALQGEQHHGVVPDGGVPTFLASLPDRDIPAEDSPRHSELRHVELVSDAPVLRELNRDHDHQGEGVGGVGVGGGGGDPHFDSEQVCGQAQHGEHHHGVPTFMVALPDDQISADVTKGVESTHDSADNISDPGPQ